MGTVSVSLPSDGETIDAADYNTPITTIVNEFNGNIDNANVKSGAAIATAKLATDAGITTGMLADDAVTSPKINVAPSVDADSWSVADLGAFKIYSRQFTGVTTGSTGANADAATNFASISFPTNVAPADVVVLCDGFSTDGATRWKFFVDGYTSTSVTTTDTFDIGARNLTTSTVTMAGGTCNVIMIEKA